MGSGGSRAAVFGGSGDFSRRQKFIEIAEPKSTKFAFGLYQVRNQHSDPGFLFAADFETLPNFKPALL